MKTFVLSTLAALLLIPSIAVAKTIPYADDSIDITVPDDWKVDTHSAMTAVTDPAGEIGIMFFVMKNKVLSTEYFQTMPALVKGVLRDANVKTDSHRTSVNGMTARIGQGDGFAGDKKMRFFAVMVQANENTVVMMLGMTEEALFADRLDVIEKLMTDVKPHK